jgi:hypothetical protein
MKIKTLIIFFILGFHQLTWAQTPAPQTKKKDAVVEKPVSANVGGKEITSTADLYSALPVEAKKSEVVGGLVKHYSGNVDILCAQASKVCVVTFKK